MLTRSQFARWIGIIAGALLIITALWWMPFYPVWSLAYVLIGILLIYGLAVYGGRDPARLLTITCQVSGGRHHPPARYAGRNVAPTAVAL